MIKIRTKINNELLIIIRIEINVSCADSYNHDNYNKYNMQNPVHEKSIIKELLLVPLVA